MEEKSTKKRREVITDPASMNVKRKKPKSKKSKRKERQAMDDFEEERRLASILFGEETVRVNFASQQESEDQEEADQPLFEIDRTGIPDDTLPEEDDRNTFQRTKKEHNDDGSEEDHAEDGGGPAWIDEDDAGLQVNLLGTSRLRKLRTTRTEEAASALNGVELEQRLRQRHQSTAQNTARTDWARVTEEPDADRSEEEEETGLQSSSAPLLIHSSARRRLPPNTINIMRCPDANQSDPNQAVVQAVHFHPASDADRPLLLTAGLDKTLRFFQVGAEKSEKVHGIHFPKLPIYSASFLGSSGNVVVSGRRPFFYVYDAVTGKFDVIPRIIGREEKSLEKCVASPDGRTIAFVGNDGYVILFDANAKQWIADLKMNGSVRSLSFAPDGEQILGSGSDGDVYRWEMRTRQCVERFSNEDGTITSSLASSSRHIAVGAESGVVNLYSGYNSGLRRGSSLLTRRSPLKSIMNLHTSADALRFNSDGQILAMSTRREKHGMKLLHVPSATVFSNWPTSKTPLNYVWSMDFSPESRFLAVGNDKGNCLLYQLMHYQD